MTTHYLKCIPIYFYAIRDGFKPYEVRKDDRHFCVGDILVLRLWVSCSGSEGYYLKPDGNPCHHQEGYEAHFLKLKITHKLDGGQFGIEPGYCVLGIKPCP